MNANHDGTNTLDSYNTWIACGACGQKVTGDSSHTCPPQLKELTGEEILEVADQFKEGEHWLDDFEWVIPESEFVNFASALLRKAQEK